MAWQQKPRREKDPKEGDNNQLSTSDPSKWVTVYLGGKRHKLFTDTGSKFTLITPDMYSEEMGKVVPAKYRLRAWGSNKKLDVKGMVRATISTKRGVPIRGRWS